MKRLFILTFLGCFLLISNLAAATADLNDLLNVKKRPNTQGTIYTGTPFVYIDSDEDTSQKPQKFEPLPYQPSYTFDIKTPFGQKAEASFVPHTTDFTDKIQVLSNGDAVIEETIQFINTRRDYAFERVISKSNADELTLVKATLDNRALSIVADKRPPLMTVDEMPTAWTIKDSQILSPGVHTYVLTYLLKNAVRTNGQIATVRLSLTGSHWTLPIERFSAVVLLPNKTPLFKQDVLFGANNQKIPETTEVYTDENGNFFLSLNRPLPAYADVKINLDFDKKALETSTFWETLFDNATDMLFLIGVGILILYAMATAMFLKFTKSALYPIKQLAAYNLITLRYISGNAFSHSFASNLIKYNTYKKKRVPFIKIWSNMLLKYRYFAGILGRGYALFDILYKYVITQGLIVGLIIWQAWRVQMPLGRFQIAFLIILGILNLFFIYFKCEKPYIKREMTKFLDNAFSTDIGFGLSVASIQALFIQFYPIMLALGQQKDWVNYIKQYKINFTGLTFLDEKETSI